MNVKTKDLVVGTRYWLDKMKDTSAVFVRHDVHNTQVFNKQEGKCDYPEWGKCIYFENNNHDFYSID